MAAPHVELSPAGDRIDLASPYDPSKLPAIKKLGARWQKDAKLWRLPLTLTTGRRLREIYGPSMTIGPRLLDWARAQRRHEDGLADLAAADKAELVRIPRDYPALHARLQGRWWQAIDVAMMARANMVNGNDPGAGKTLETIAAIIEAGLENGRHLIVAPVNSHDVVWRYEIEAALPGDATVLWGETPAERKAAVAEAAQLAKLGEGFWLVVNRDMVRLHAEYGLDELGRKKEVRTWYEHPAIQAISWTTVTLDEFHKIGLTNRKTLTSRGIAGLKRERAWGLSGTPMGGKPVKLWGALNYCAPKVHTSLWGWVDTWLEVEEKKGYNGQVFGKEIKGVQPGREDEFYAAMAPHFFRRTTEEMFPDLAKPAYVEVRCRMTKAQAKAYKDLDDKAVLVDGAEVLEVAGVLAEYTRLKQLAAAESKLVDGNLVALPKGGKFTQLAGRLAERGIDPEDPEGDERALVCTQFKPVAEAVVAYLNDLGIPAALLTGDTKKKDLNATVRSFQSNPKTAPYRGGRNRRPWQLDDGAPRVLVMTTQTGGMSITMDRAESLHLLDETWDPDDTRQALGRLWGRGRNHQVTVYRYLMLDTVEQYIRDVTDEKGAVNVELLDTRRRAYRAARRALAAA